MAKRLPAFTIIELIMSLLISSVVISIVFYVYLFFNKQFLQYQARSGQVNDYFLFKQVLQNDLDRAGWVEQLPPAEILCRMEAGGVTVHYHFLDSMITRQYGEAVDTFRIRNHVAYAGNTDEVEEKEPVNKIILRLLVAGSTVDAVFLKQYSARQFMQQATTHE